MKRICIALDTSPSAKTIAKMGFEYALVFKAEVVLVHVLYDFSSYSYTYSPIMGYNGVLIKNSKGFVGDLKEEAYQFLHATAKFFKQPDVEIQVLKGDTNHEILKFAKIWNADLLVIGTHSHSMLENVLIGNIALKIVKHSKIPLLLVPTKHA